MDNRNKGDNKMQLTKYEKIIFLERDIEALEKNLKCWRDYADGIVDMYTENAYILSDAEQKIIYIHKMMSEITSSEPIGWPPQIYDIFCEYNFNSKEHFMNCYEKVIRCGAIKNFEYAIKKYSPESAKKEVEEIKSDLSYKKAELWFEMGELNGFEKFKLNVIKWNPKSKVNSPSFCGMYITNAIAEAMAKGIEQGIKGGARMKLMTPIVKAIELELESVAPGMEEDNAQQ